MSVLDKPVRSRLVRTSGAEAREGERAEARIVVAGLPPRCSIVVVAAVLVGIGWADHWAGADFHRVGDKPSCRS